MKNFEQNAVAGSTILNFSDAQWNALIPSLGFGNYVRQQRQAKERISEQEMRTTVWNSSRKKAMGSVMDTGYGFGYGHKYG